MTQPIGEEFIRIRPDLSAFRAELNAQLQGALRGAATQAAAATAPLAQATDRVTRGGVILPSTVKSVENLGAAAAKTTPRMRELGDATRRPREATDELDRAVRNAERSTGRYARGLIAATAASSGFFRAVSFASGAFLVGAAVGATIGAAVTEFTEMTRVGAQTAAVLRATGEAANVTAQQMDALATAQLRLTGTDDELIKQAGNVLFTFRNIRNETGRGNDVFNRSVRAVQDISAVFRTDLRGSAVQLGKALQDPVRGVTALRRSGISLTQGQRDLIKELVRTGRILTAQKLILGEVERQVGGTAAAYGRTLPGRLAIMREEAVNSLGEFVKRVSESDDATKAFERTMGALRDTFATFRNIAVGTASAFAQIAEATRLTDLGRAAAGSAEFVRTIAQAVGAFVAFRLALRAVTAAQNLYVRATTVATAATAAEGAAAAAATTRISLASAALGALRGPLGIALGLTAVTVGFIKLREAVENAPGTFKATERALNDLNDAIERNVNLRSRLAGQSEDVSLGRFNVQAAERDLARAEAALQASTAAEGSLEQIALTNRVRDATQKLADATRDLRDAERGRDVTLERIRTSERQRGELIRRTTRDVLENVRALGTQARVLRLGLFGQNFELPSFFGRDTASAATQLAQFDNLVRDLAASGSVLDARLGRALRAIKDTLNTMPTERQVRVVVSILGRGLTTNQALQAIGIGREAGTEQIRLRGLAAVGADASLEQEFLRQKAILATLRQKEQQARKNLAVQRQEVRAAREAVAAASEARTTAVQALADAQRGLSDAVSALRQTIIDSHNAVVAAIQASREAVRAAISDAKQNLDSLGDTLGGLLERAAQEVGQARGSGRFGELRERIRRGEGGPETIQAAQQVAFALQSQPNNAAEDLTKALNLLTDDLNTGLVRSMPEFNRRLAQATQGIDLKELRRIDPLLARQITRYINALRRQAGEILARGRPGAVQPQFVSIGNAIREGQKSIADARRQAAADIRAATRNVSDAQRDVADAVEDVAKAERQLRQALIALRREQAKETRLNTVATNRHRRVLEQNNRLLRTRFVPLFQAGSKPKPRGARAQETTEVTQARAQGP